MTTAEQYKKFEELDKLASQGGGGMGSGTSTNYWNPGIYNFINSLCIIIIYNRIKFL